MTGDARDADELARRLSGVVRGEAHRMLSDTQRAPDPARVAAGWTRRFITDGTRLAEITALYEAAGFEVCADPIRRGELTDDCDDCQLLALLQFRTVYTRPRTNPRPGIETGVPAPHL